MWQVATDGATCVFAVAEDPKFTWARPPGDDLNHFQNQLRASPILLVGGLPDLFAFEFTAAAGSQFGILPLAVKADEDRQCPDLVRGKGEGDVQGKDLSFAKNASANITLRCDAFIAMMQAAELRDLDDPSDA